MQYTGFRKKSKTLMAVGPSDRTKIKRHGKAYKNYEQILEKLAITLVAKFDKLIVIADRGVYLDFAIKFRKAGGKVDAYLPIVGTENYENLRNNAMQNGFNPKKTKWNWTMLNNYLIRTANAVICLGYSSGVLIELGNVSIMRRWSSRKIKVYVDRRFVSRRLPPELEEDIKPKYFKNEKDLNMVCSV